MIKKIALICALEDELKLFKTHEHIPVFYSGVGKVNAAICAATVIANYKPDLLINFGTAGSYKYPLGSLVKCTHFYQRDMDASALGFEKGLTPFEPKENLLLSFSDSEKPVICSSGDSFEQAANKSVIGDVFEMEAYAIAKACKQHKVFFEAYKFISDSASEETSSKDWNVNVSNGAKAFQKIYDSLRA